MSDQPSKYARNYGVPIEAGVRYVVRFDKRRGSITRFVVQLQRQTDAFEMDWRTFAQIDHEPNHVQGHDLYREGIHIDIYHEDGTSSKIRPSTGAPLPTPGGVLLNMCKDYLVDNAEYFRQAARKQIPLDSPPDVP